MSDVDEFVAACRSVATGGRVVDPMVAHELLATRRAGDPVERLTAREREVLSAMARVLSNSAIASSSR